MDNRPWSVMLLVFCAGTALAQPKEITVNGTITPNAILDSTHAVQAEAPKPVLSPETRGDIYMARKMYREAIEAFREGPRRTRFCATRSASPITR